MDNLGYSSDYIERNGFFFVCDCVKPETMEIAFKLIEKLQNVEKSNNITYPKMLLFNMCDKVTETEFFNFIKEKVDAIENFKGKYKLDILKVSALTGQGINDAFRRFLGRIHQEMSNAKQNDGIPEQDDDNKDRLYLGDYSCGDGFKSFFFFFVCGNQTLTGCGFFRGDGRVDGSSLFRV